MRLSAASAPTMFILYILSLFAGLGCSFPAEQEPLTAPSIQESVTAQKDAHRSALRKLQGRFLHITGIYLLENWRALQVG